MNKSIFAVLLLMLMSLIPAGCSVSGLPESTTGSGIISGGTDINTPEGDEDSPFGIWYEQDEYGGILEITEDKIIYSWENLSGEEYSTDSECWFEEKSDRILISTKEEDLFYYVDMYYDREQDIIVGYTWPVMDGDGGYHYTEFHRTEYIAPPPPVYDPPVDLSDPDAQKEFDDLTFTHMSVFFYDEGEYYDPSSSMAMEPPYPDEYSYDLYVQEDGSALVSSSFCQEIDIPKEIVDELQEMVTDNDLGSINGLDIHTPGLPYGEPDYEIELELKSGEIIRSSANGPDVPENWQTFRYAMHRLLFNAFVDAGYKLNGQFHSTKPMKRIGIPEEDRIYPDIQFDQVVTVYDGEKSYDYSLDTKYFTFTGDSEKYPELMKTLDDMSAYYKEKSEESLESDHEYMESIPESVRKEAERLYCYSFYVVEYTKCCGPIFSFFLSEGHADSIGLRDFGYGDYPNYRVNIDVETGEIIAFSDLFTDVDTACNVVIDTLRDRFDNYHEVGRFINSDEFPVKLREFIDKTHPGGLDWFAYYDHIDVFFPNELFPMEEYQIQQTFYYDGLQDELSDKYTTVW